MADEEDDACAYLGVDLLGVDLLGVDLRVIILGRLRFVLKRGLHRDPVLDVLLAPRLAIVYAFRKPKRGVS